MSNVGIREAGELGRLEAVSRLGEARWYNPAVLRKEHTRWRSAYGSSHTDAEQYSDAAHNWQRTQRGTDHTTCAPRSLWMANRTFVDPRGVMWSVTVIVPQLTERRLTDRRSASAMVVDFRAERRMQPDRRHLREVRAPVREGFEQGWLVFDNGDEKRRLAPVPEGWERMSAQDLESLRSRAKPSHQRWTRLVE